MNVEIARIMIFTVIIGTIYITIKEKRGEYILIGFGFLFALLYLFLCVAVDFKEIDFVYKVEPNSNISINNKGDSIFIETKYDVKNNTLNISDKFYYTDKIQYKTDDTNEIKIVAKQTEHTNILFQLLFPETTLKSSLYDVVIYNISNKE